MSTNGMADGVADLMDLSDQTRQARTELEELELARDTEIIRLLKAGHSTREVANAARLTQARVVQIHTKARNAANHPVVDGGVTA